MLTSLVQEDERKQEVLLPFQVLLTKKVVSFARIAILPRLPGHIKIHQP